MIEEQRSTVDDEEEVSLSFLPSPRVEEDRSS
jgi:hypothetical protein